jgi:RNA-directed DNA polymerase
MNRREIIAGPRCDSPRSRLKVIAPLALVQFELAKLLAVKIELRRKMHDPIAKTGAWVKQMLKGHLNYFAVSGNQPTLWWFFNKLKRLWLASLKRRSQTARLSWEKFTRLVARFFPPIRTLHPLPCHRFDARTQGRSPVR